MDSGEITLEWSVWREGLEAWSPIGAISDFTPAPPPPPPAPPAPPVPRKSSAPAKKPASTTASAGVGIGAIVVMALAGVIGQGIGRGAVDFLCRAPLGAPKEFVSRDGGFSVRIPSSHEVTTQRQPIAGTTSTLTMHMGIHDRSPYAFAAGWMNIPSDANFDFQQGMEGAVQNLNGTVLQHSTISYRGSPGREFTFQGRHGTNDVSGIARIYLIQRRTVMLIFFKLGHDATNPPAAKAFLESFTFRGS